MSEDMKWLTDLEKELELGGPDEEDGAPLADIIKRMRLTPKGWSRVRDIILRADEDTNVDLFHRLLLEDEDDAFMFISMVALPYSMGKTLGYQDEYLETMITLVAASYAMAMTKGYAAGQKDMIEERPSRDE